MKILIPLDITQAGKDYLQQHGYEYKVGSSTDEDVVAKEIADCDALLIRTSKVTRRIMESAKNLKVIGRHGVGVDNIDLEAATELGIQVTNGPTSNSDSVAEHTVSLMLACGHNIVPMNQYARNGQWEMRDAIKLNQIAGKTLGLLGFGRIGQAVAQKCALGFSMNVLAYSPSIGSKKLPDYITPASSMEEVLAQSDYISLHLPATEKTKHSMNKTVFQQMKNTAFLINTARGDIVHEGDLFEALSTGEIAGAGLDVLEIEPPSPNHPLFSLDNVIMSPHYAALSHTAFDTMGLHAAQGIHEVLSGQTPTWPVNQLKK